MRPRLQARLDDVQRLRAQGRGGGRARGAGCVAPRWQGRGGVRCRPCWVCGGRSPRGP